MIGARSVCNMPENGSGFDERMYAQTTSCVWIVLKIWVPQARIVNFLKNRTRNAKPSPEMDFTVQRTGCKVVLHDLFICKSEVPSYNFASNFGPSRPWIEQPGKMKKSKMVQAMLNWIRTFVFEQLKIPAQPASQQGRHPLLANGSFQLFSAIYFYLARKEMHLESSIQQLPLASEGPFCVDDVS